MSHQFASPKAFGLRSIQKEDAEKFKEWEGKERPYPWSKEQFWKVPRPFHTRVLVWEENEAIIGYAVVQIVVDEGYLLNFLVQQKFRRQGKGTEFLRRILDWSARSGANDMYLDVDSSQSEAIGLYEKVGFKIVQHRQKGYPNGEDAIVMKKQLTQLEERVQKTPGSRLPKKLFDK